jgi:hypothetical protein
VLITNFSSGELSKNLFGRIDLPQYHSGVAHLENFDVITTGGIKRRSGMERLLSQDISYGRLIPFVVNRDINFLLYLTPEKIRIYKIENGSLTEQTPPFKSSLEWRLYESLDHICDVQYAQNFDTMILCHENYPPLEVKLMNNLLVIDTFYIECLVSIKSSEGLNWATMESDAIYIDNDYLKTPDNYPRTVSFFNGRVVFAGTKKNPQRVLLSRVDNFHNFSTYNKFVSEKREYLTIQSNILSDRSIHIAAPEIAIKFVKPINEYYVDSIYFPKGAMIKSLIGTTMQIEPPMSGFFDEEKIINEMNSKKNKYNAAETKDSITKLYIKQKIFAGIAYHTVIKPGPYDLGDKERWYEFEWIIYYGANHIKFRVRSRDRRLGESFSNWSYAEVGKDYNSENDIAKNDNNEIKRKIKEALSAGEDSLYTDRFYGYKQYEDIYTGKDIDNFGSYYTGVEKNKYYTAQHHEEIINDMMLVIPETMKYYLHSNDDVYNEWYYDIPENYIKDIVPFLTATNNIYVSFYTREIIKNEYPSSDCGFTFEIASSTNDAIRWLCANRGLIVGTEMGEWLIPPDVHATNVQAISLSKHGSDRIQGEALGDATLFFKSGRKGLVEYYPNDNDHFRANNMALLAQHMLHESPAKEFDYATNPYTKLFITREDGMLVTLLYERMTGTFAWSRITTGEIMKNMITQEETDISKKAWNRKVKDSQTQYSVSHPGPYVIPERLERFVEGRVLSCAVLPGEDGFDDVYLVVKRKSGEGDEAVYKYYLERLREEGTVYLDNWSEWTFENEEQRQSLLDSYDSNAVVYDEKENRQYRLNEELPAKSCEENRRYIGYPYQSIMESMPIVKDEKMKAVNMTRMCVRLLDSYEPDIWGSKGDKNSPTDGVVESIDMLSGQSTSKQFTIVHEDPNRCRVLSVYAEV